MGTDEYSRIPQYTWVTRIVNTHVGAGRTQITYLSNGAGTCIIFTVLMNNH